MGNHCCAFREPKCQFEGSPASQQNLTVVVAADGRVVQVEVPSGQANMKVGELLLEFPPAHFVCHFPRSFFHFDPAAIPRLYDRTSPLGADADAMPGAAHVYVLFPMPRLHTRLTSQEHLTFARLLQGNHGIPRQYAQNLLMEDNLLESGRSRAKRVSCFWGGRGAIRVAPAPHEQEKASLTPPPSDQVRIIAGANEEEEQELVPKQALIKPKPWAPRLQTISEGHED